MEVYRSTIIDAPIDRVWALVRPFDSLRAWHPAVSDCRIEDGGSASRVGCLRRITLRDGGIIRETLLSLSDSEHAFSYNIIESPMPIENYVAHTRLLAVTDAQRTFIDWSARFDTGQSAEMETLIGEGIFVGGFGGIRAALGVSSAPPAQGLAKR